MNIAVVVGNPKPRSRTSRVAEGLADRLATAVGGERVTTVDLADHAASLFSWPAPDVDALNKEVAESDLLVVASPTYKASYTGLLKAFLDRYAFNALQGVIAVPVMTTSSPDHALAVEFTLRPLLVELGASVPTRGLNFAMADMPRVDEVLDEWVEQNIRPLSALGRFATVPGPPLGSGSD